MSLSAKWHPEKGQIAKYLGRTRAQIRNVRIVAEACRGRMVVEAIGRQGIPVLLTVLKENLVRPEPDLFFA